MPKHPAPLAKAKVRNSHKYCCLIVLSTRRCKNTNIKSVTTVVTSCEVRCIWLHLHVIFPCPTSWFLCMWCCSYVIQLCRLQQVSTAARKQCKAKLCVALRSMSVFLHASNFNDKFTLVHALCCIQYCSFDMILELKQQQQHDTTEEKMQPSCLVRIIATTIKWQVWLKGSNKIEHNFR